jgi:aminopeptidase N
MKNICIQLCLLALSITQLSAQNKPVPYNPIAKPNTYQNLDNPNYWKNKKPHSDYWQQDVYYQIQANIDEQKDIIEGKETLTYWNNSPDDLDVVYFHLYQNAFQPESHHADLNEQNKNKINYGEYEQAKKGTEVNKITADGRKILLEQDNTILKVHLSTPIKSGESIDFNIDFTTYFGQGEMGRRMKKFNSNGKMHYDGVHWYPRISVYDAKFGWTTDQHLGKEFYGDFGTFDVELTFSSNYVVDATGFLLNRNTVLPAELRAKLDITNFKDKPWNEPASEVIAYNPSERKTWKFHAENVHDFAFTADPSYRIGEATWNGITCYALAQEQHASKWQNAASYAAKIIQVFSEDIGMYTYHKMIVADARDGMEYPMLTLDGGADPDYRGLLVHEIGHNWFYGQVGNNETYRAALDEGFTQFLTAWGLEKIDGEEMVRSTSKNKYIAKHTKPLHPRDRSVYYAYINDATKNNTPQLNTHSDDFGSALGHGGGYRHVYYKTAAMLYNLQYVLGDKLFIESLQYYFQKWKIAHPYFDDFRQSIIEYTKVDLNWFFDQWLETTKDIDYAVKSAKRLKGSDELYKVTFERKAGMQMPIDFSIIDKSGLQKDYHIPNTWFVKETDATILDKWYGFGKVHQKHSVIIRSPKGIQNVVIDPTNRLADAYMPNNSLKKNISVSWEDFVWSYPDWKKYELSLRPKLWYNGYDGIKTGIRFTGDYMNYHHKFDGTFWVNTGIGQIENNISDVEISYIKDDTLVTESVKTINDYNRFAYEINYNTPLNKVNKGLNLNAQSRRLDGLDLHNIRFNQNSNDNNQQFYISLKAMRRASETSSNYLLLPDEEFWATNKWNNTITAGLKHHYDYFNGSGQINLALRSSTLESDYQYAQISLEAINESTVKSFNIKTRFFALHSSGTSIAPESKLFAAGANPEQLMNNPFTRSAGVISRDWVSYSSQLNQFHMGGGLNLRAYSGYLMPEGEGDNQTFTYSGSTGASFSSEIEFDEYLPFTRRLNMVTYLFTDAGIINKNSFDTPLEMGSLRMDAGLGATITLFNKLDNVTPLTIRVDLPWFMNKPPYQENYFDLKRFVIGINRSF